MEPLKIKKKSEIESIINYTFKNKTLINQALTHSSSTLSYKENYERLEFLGDSILNFIVTKMLLKKYPNSKEGELSKKRSKIVNFKTLSKAFKDLKLDSYINTGKSVKAINNKMISDCYESLIGAIFIDSNLNNAEIFILNTLLNNIENYETEMNFKGSLIEYCMKKNISIPVFKTIYIDDHKAYKTKIQIKSMKIECYSEASNKKDAEKECSKIVLRKLDSQHPI